jgi:hypothetical protein
LFRRCRSQPPRIAAAAFARPEAAGPLEYHSADVDWWDDIVTGIPKPLVKDGFIAVPDKPGLGIDDVVDEVIGRHLQPGVTGIWQSTEHWDNEYSWDRTWS